MNKISKVLIANRGEIAIRIQNACRKAGIAHVSVASEVDKDALFVRLADEFVVIGPAPASESYLNIDALMRAAKETGCDALHPGYGFLSENPELAERSVEAGLVFIGPDAESIRTLGSKTLARQAVTANGVPTTAGTAGGLTDEEIFEAAPGVGFPVIIKAVGGGGGRGMRIAESLEDLRTELPLARGEAGKNFGNNDVYLERYVQMPRHVEVQIFGDHHGNVIHFGTRDCSIQRRHQKLVEEAPAPNLSDSLREKIHDAAVKAGQSVNYRNAGTVEFLVKGDEFFFLEINTRIQVEHPVTEEVTGVDLVELQLRVATGEKLPMSQGDVRFTGHAIEYRVYAEDPSNDFRPATGKITRLVRPTDEHLREDYAVEEGDVISPYYDALISKVIIRGEDRSQAIARSREILNEYSVRGVPTTLPFHSWVLQDGSFINSKHDIGYVERHFTADSLRDFAASQIRDECYQAPVGGAEVKNFYEYRSEKFNETYTIEVLHGSDGFFLAVPVNQSGKRAKTHNCRRSNGLNTAVKSVIEDVLEKSSPSEIFDA